MDTSVSMYAQILAIGHRDYYQIIVLILKGIRVSDHARSTHDTFNTRWVKYKEHARIV